MSLVMSKTEFKAKALACFRQIESSGESALITDHGQPKLEIRPYRAPEKDPLTALAGSVLHYDNPTEPVGENHWDLA